MTRPSAAKPAPYVPRQPIVSRADRKALDASADRLDRRRARVAAKSAA